LCTPMCLCHQAV